MPERTTYEPGTFCWVDLATTDPVGAKAFYTGLFGWEPDDMPAGEGMTYTMFRLQGKYVSALGEQPEEERSQGIPSHWNVYVSVDDLERYADRARSAGGKVLAEPFEVLDAGRMAVVADPTGAIFCMWEPARHQGAELVMEDGALSWCELSTRDTAAAAEFYGSVFGWRADTETAGGMPYTLFRAGDSDRGGMMQIGDEWGDMPPSWGVYFEVGDCDASASRAKDLGGQIVVPPTDIPGVGRFSVLQDPQGASFSVIKGAPQQ